MVKVCSLEYPKDGKDEYVEYFNFFKYELHDFQKWSIEAIVTGNHVLITAPTGIPATSAPSPGVSLRILAPIPSYVLSK